jgi:hypothetical protein
MHGHVVHLLYKLLVLQYYYFFFPPFKNITTLVLV